MRETLSAAASNQNVVRDGIQSERCPRRHPMGSQLSAAAAEDIFMKMTESGKMLSGTASNEKEVVRGGIQSKRCPSRHPIRMMSAAAPEEIFMETIVRKDVVRDGIQ